MANRELLNHVTKNINYITPFNGDKFSLAGFLSRIENTLSLATNLNDIELKITYGLITDKIVGKAKESLLKAGVVSSWVELKEILLRNHGEKTPISELIDDVKLCRCDTTIEFFYKKLSFLLCRLNNAQILLGQCDQEHANSNNRLVLKHFIENLPPLAKNLLVCRETDKLDDAYDLLIKYGYINESFSKNKSFLEKVNYSKPNSQSKNKNIESRSNYNRDLRNNAQSSQTKRTFNKSNYQPGNNNYSNNYHNNNRNTDQRNFHDNDRVEPMEISVNQTNETIPKRNFRKPGPKIYPI